MTVASHGRGRTETLAPSRTCIGCRRVRPQGGLLRIVRTADGFVEPDPERRRGGRGAYLCRSESCFVEAVRRGRWARAFRRPAVLRPETAERIRVLIGAERELSSRRSDGVDAGVRPGGRREVPVEGGR
ncbi:MAG: YlxR family protein [Candidatus Rokubacteria bacterium]|nr:YlxR family protein [Candidatus Rokubacteria bacterium]